MGKEENGMNEKVPLTSIYYQVSDGWLLEVAVQHREPGLVSVMTCRSGIEEGKVSKNMTDSCCCMAETNTIL